MGCLNLFLMFKSLTLLPNYTNKTEMNRYKFA